MAFKAIKLCLAVMVLVSMLSAGAIAQSGCTNVIIGMSPCLNFITGNSSSPSSSCCSQLSSVLQSQPQCLCSVLNGGGAALGLAINQTLALALPGACNVQTPSVSQCNAANEPATSPATSPVDIPANSPSTLVPGATAESPSDIVPGTPSTPANNIPAGTGSKTVPTTGSGDASGGILAEISLHWSLFLLFVVSCVSAATSF